MESVRKVNLINSNKKSNYIKIVLISICVIIPFTFINRGLDVADTGYILNSYKFIFSNPESINFSIIFTSVIGNIILNIFEFLNIPSYLGFKIVSAIFSLSTCFLVIKYLKRYFNENILLLGTIIALLLARGHISVLMYTNLTAFILTILSLFLIKGIIEDKKIYIFFSGILLGINIFIRISNFAQIILVLSIIYYGCKNKEYKRMNKQILFFLLGVLISIFTSIIFIIIIFGKTQFLSMMGIYLGEAIASKDSHSVMDSIKINLNQGINGLFWIVILWGGTFIADYYTKNSKFISKNIKKIYSLFIFIPIIFIILKYLGADKIFLIEKIYLVFYSLYQPFSICVAFYGVITIYKCFIKKDMDYSEALIFLIGLLVMMSMPMGSNQGFNILYQSFYIQAPLVIVFIFSVFKNSNKTVKRKMNIFQKSMLLFMITYFILMILVRNIGYSYRDTPALNNYKINDTNLECILTTKDRAKVMDEVLDSIKPYANKDKKLISYGSIPLFSYLLDMPPFFEGFNGWIEMDQLSIKSMKNSINESEKNKDFPLIIISKIGTNNSSWPNEQTKEIMNNIIAFDPKYGLIKKYISRNNFNLVFENDAFIVYYNNEIE